ncbi:YhbY family RNA-binding protein, partial [Bordetella petrii]|uniref:YhbY family RNA-binding protein n=1 Tax=Bordetella petrii TaxID=94624 RepID=UPI001E53C50A
MPILELTSRERSDLRSAAHPLRPVVLIGDNGLTDAVLKEIDRALTSHGLIKVRAGGSDRDEREAMLASICDTLSCAPVHHLGKILILFRPLPGNVAPAPAEGTPARRKPSEPHTPKKLAAEGKTLSKPRRAPRKPADAEPARPAARATLNKAGKPMRPTTKKAASSSPHGIPRRAGSALSLRA